MSQHPKDKQPFNPALDPESIRKASRPRTEETHEEPSIFDQPFFVLVVKGLFLPLVFALYTVLGIIIWLPLCLLTVFAHVLNILRVSLAGGAVRPTASALEHAFGFLFRGYRHVFSILKPAPETTAETSTDKDEDWRRLAVHAALAVLFWFITLGVGREILVQLIRLQGG